MVPSCTATDSKVPRLVGQDVVGWPERDIKMSLVVPPSFSMAFDHFAHLPLFNNGIIESARVSKKLLPPWPGLNSLICAPLKLDLPVNNSRKPPKTIKISTVSNFRFLLTFTV